MALSKSKPRKLSSLELKSLRARQRMGLEEVHVKLYVPSPDVTRTLELVKGDTGPEGPIGETGAEGPRGLRGGQGFTGDRGEKGYIGETGSRGQTGMAGATAEKGAVGPEGKVGLIGKTGPAGTAGTDGTPGSQGISGKKGGIGATGATGQQGEQGAQGEQGRHGTTVAGPPGLAGAPGTKGDTGDCGLTGEQGIPGVPGSQGDSGDKGADEEVTKDVLKRLKKLEEVTHYHRLFPRDKTVDRAFAGGIGYTDADAIAAVEGEATLDLLGGVTVASDKSLSLLTDGSTGGVKFGASSDVHLFRGGANQLHLASGDDFHIVSGALVFGAGVKLSNPSADILRLEAGDTFEVDTITETTFGAGVTIDGLLIKDKTIIDAWVDLTISSGRVTRTNLMHTLAGEGATADNLVGIDGGADGMLLILHAVSDTVTITLKHNDVGGESANGTRLLMSDNADITLDDVDDLVIMVFDSALDTDGAWIVLVSGGGGSSHDILDGSVHQDSVADGVTAGSIIIGNDTPKWDELVITVPASGLINHLAVANGETTPSWKALFDATVPVTQAHSDAAATGTAVVAARRDHKHGMPVAADSSIHHIVLTRAGTIPSATATDISDFDDYAPRIATYTKVRASVKTAPSGAALVIVIKNPSSTLHTITIADGAKTEEDDGLSLSVTEDQKIVIDVTTSNGTAVNLKVVLTG